MGISDESILIAKYVNLIFRIIFLTPSLPPSLPLSLSLSLSLSHTHIYIYACLTL